MIVVCSWVCQFVDVFGRKFEAIGKGFEGGSVIPSSLTGS